MGPIRDSILTEDPKTKEKFLKFAKNEQFKDETLGKTLINYIKAYDSPEVIKNRLRQNNLTKKIPVLAALCLRISRVKRCQSYT